MALTEIGKDGQDLSVTLFLKLGGPASQTPPPLTEARQRVGGAACLHSPCGHAKSEWESPTGGSAHEPGSTVHLPSGLLGPELCQSSRRPLAWAL